MVDNKRIAKNTFLLYVRMIILMFVNLYTSRIILESLGVNDYGVYNVVGGFVGMFAIISNSLSTAISRYLTFTLGKNEQDTLKEVFSTSIIIQLILCCIVLLLVETFGVWFLNTKLNIPIDSTFAANWVLQFSLVSFIFNLLNVPYNAVIIAHERMKAFAYIGIIEGFANLLVAFIVLWANCNKLILYASLTCFISVCIRLIYTLYCKHNFDECSFVLKFYKQHFSDMFGFAGWNFIGSASGLLRSQGLNILFNIYNGPVVNAARGLSVQVEIAVTKFTSSFYTAVQPQITKTIATNEYSGANILACRSSRLAFFLLCLLCIPIIFNVDYILSIWLKEIPQYTSEFVVVILLMTLVESFSQPLIHLMLATGDIKTYQIAVGFVVLLSFFVGWGLLWLGYSPIFVQASIIIFSVIALFVRVNFLRKMVCFPAKYFYLNTVIRCLCLLSAICILSFIVNRYFHSSFFGFLISVSLIELISVTLIFLFGLHSSERNFILNKVRAIFRMK